METANRAAGNSRIVDDEGAGILVDVDTGLLRMTPSWPARTFVFVTLWSSSMVVVLNSTVTYLLFRPMSL